MPGANQGSTAGKPGGKFEEPKEIMKSFLEYETARFKREERRLRNMEQPFSRIQEQFSLIKEKDHSKGSTGTNSDAEASKILAENRRLMREQKEEQLRLQREEEEKMTKEEEMRLAEEARLIRLQEEKKLAEEKKIKDEEDALLAEEERVKMVEKVRQERERVMQQNQQERRERKNQIPKRKKGKLPSDFTPPPEETMLHKGKQKHQAEWRHMEESKMAKINKCRRNEKQNTRDNVWMKKGRFCSDSIVP
ncbi:Dynactin subunit 1 [Dissostichus eleginoides]|uniref:Dynactin subunit 1 n=1 Tax=Dissostichus eleginoides TaxID=100907 RepID=A0AAD9FEA7_DISEL|nr:Dynactin subunit 1 [Dissostichus eleginoides]